MKKFLFHQKYVPHPPDNSLPSFVFSVTAQDLSELMLPGNTSLSTSDNNSTAAAATADESGAEGDDKLVAVAGASSAKILHKSSPPGDKSTAEGDDKLDVEVDAWVTDSTDISEL